MDCLLYKCASFKPDSSIGQLCEDLNKIPGYRIYYDTFEIQNTKCIWLVYNFISIMNSNKVCCSFCVYPIYVAGILNSVNKIHLFVLQSEKLNYAEYVEKCIVREECTFNLPTDYSFKVVTEHRFQLTFCSATVKISIVVRQFQRLPSELISAQCVLKTMRLSSVAYGIVLSKIM